MISTSSSTLATGEVDELSGALDDGATLGRPCNRDAAPAPKLEQPLVAKHAQGTEHGVRVDPEDGGEILGRGKALSRLRLSVRRGRTSAEARRTSFRCGRTAAVSCS